MKNKYFKTALCLGVGVITLTAAVFANYDNANGYSVCKNAAKSILFETNYTLNTRIEMKVDGESMGKYEAVYKTAGKQDPNKYTSTTESTRKSPSDDFETTSYEQISQDDCEISINTDGDGVKSSYVYKNYDSDGEVYNSDDGSLIGNRSELTGKVINFAELACDALVGDLKNSIILVDSNNSSNKYNISLSENQMPDLISSGASLLMGGIKQGFEDEAKYRAKYPDDYDNSSCTPYLYDTLFNGGDPKVDSVNGTITVSNSGLPEAANGSVYISGIGSDGKRHMFELSISFNFSDYGTTTIEKCDINSLPSPVIHGSNGSITIIKSSQATAEQQKDAQNSFDMYSTDGYSHVYLMDENGKVLDEYEP